MSSRYSAFILVPVCAAILAGCGADKNAIATACTDSVLRDYARENGDQPVPTFAPVNEWTEWQEVPRAGFSDFAVASTFTDKRGKWGFSCTVEYRDGKANSIAETFYGPGTWYLDQGRPVPK